MVRKVFYSFHYQNDITRAMIVRNRWVTFGNQVSSGIIDKADFETIQRQGDLAIKRWINTQLDGTSATVVLIGSETLKRDWVQYEILKSLERENAVIGVYINRIRDLNGNMSFASDKNTVIAYEGAYPIRFSDVADGIYDYVLNDGYNNLDSWVENALEVRREKIAWKQRKNLFGIL